MKQAKTKKLKAAHIRWLRKILHISLRDKVTHEKVRELAKQGKLEVVIRARGRRGRRERRLRWLDGARDANGSGQN